MYYEVLIWKVNLKRLFFIYYYIKYMYIVILLYKKKYFLFLLVSERRIEIFNCYKFDECIILLFYFYVKLLYRIKFFVLNFIVRIWIYIY